MDQRESETHPGNDAAMHLARALRDLFGEDAVSAAELIATRGQGALYQQAASLLKP